ncbi:MAG: response regulator [Treponema sp.]|jgi:signal transduction histidine kinase/CheY-like chemotaxis protein|nr:response regulator [Treponema sp.]
MNKNIDWPEVIKKNYRQVIFVFAAFLVMVLAGYFFVSDILQSRLLDNADDNLFSTEANIRAIFAESEISLDASSHVILEMIEDNAEQAEILEYLQSTTGWIHKNQTVLMGFYGIYGYVRGEFMDSLEYYPGEDYIPQDQPWYQAAARAGNSTVAYTEPYLDIRTGDTIISAVKNIIDTDGNFYGILVIDMNMEWINRYIKNLRPGSGGYGMIIGQNMVIMSHPDQSTLGKQLQELGGPFSDISRRLRAGEEISALRYDSSGGGQMITFFRKMFNGWYVGLITPIATYYRDLYYIALTLSVLGFVLMCALSYLLLIINAAKMKADEDSLSKSTFLAKMSHEIRTPMNAIIGMSELILREDINIDAHNYADNIRQAGNNLLAIINDILDFSKIESGRMDIVSAEYQFSSLINDVISIIKIRLDEKPLLFAARIDGSLPAVLVGDEVRVRQILLNLLTNAVKYTAGGSITFTIRQIGDPAADDKGTERVFLSFEIADTGIGIKKEDMEKLFGNFVQFDTKRNLGIEGTGLGLAISRNLCRLMGGDISVQSVYGEGSVFTALIPQVVRDKTPFAVVENPETMTILVYEKRRIYAESIVYTLNSLGLNCALAQNRNDFVERLTGGVWRFVFISPDLFDDVREIIQRQETKPALVFLADCGQTEHPAGALSLLMPVQPAMVANILNGHIRTDRHEIENLGIRFTAPDARILLVDDIEINLDVAEGLLAPYKVRLDRVAGGYDAVRLAKENRYDLIFMDHMMPDMDGIEAAAAIRAWESLQNRKAAPIIALTANAISGMREMFLEKGFNDYISKPIEIARLDDVMSRWIPVEKQIKAGAGTGREIFDDDSGLVIPGVNVKQGVNMTGGTMEGYRKVLSQFRKDAAERLDRFRDFFIEDEQGRVPGKKLALFTTQIHAIKSAAGTIGAAEVSKGAADLEAAGEAGNMAAVQEGLPQFCADLSRLIGGIEKALGLGNSENAAPAPLDSSFPALDLPLLTLKDAIKSRSMKEIDRILEELENIFPAGETKEAIELLADQVLMGEYQRAIEITDTLLAKQMVSPP